MVWLLPAALLGLVALAGPILVHLLQRRRARRTVFPSVRFVAPAEESSAHFKRISDPVLLLIRTAIVASAVLALAQPLMLTERKSAEWGRRVARAMIVDTSDSARGTITSEAILAETSSADYVTRIETRELGDGLRRGVAWLTAAPPARREIVALSDFQRGALSAEDVAQVPAEVGLRFVHATGGRATPAFPRVRVFSGQEVLAGEVLLQGDRTSITYSPQDVTRSGLQVLASPSDADAVSRLLRVVSRAGAAAPDASRPIVVRFPGAPAPPSGTTSADDWTFGAAQRLLQDTRDVNVPVSVTASAGSLIVDVDADPSSLAAARVVQAALNSRVDPDALSEAESERIPDATLSAWSRPAAPPDPTQWKGTDDSDGRWFWALTLVLLGAETLMRRSPAVRSERVDAHAA